MNAGQAGRGEKRVDRQLLAGEDAHLAGRHVGRGDERLDLVTGADSLLVEVPCQQIPQRIELERIALPGREGALDEIRPQGAG